MLDPRLSSDGLTDGMYRLKLRLEKAVSDGIRYYRQRRYAPAEEKLAEAKGLASALSAHWKVDGTLLSSIEEYLLMCKDCASAQVRKVRGKKPDDGIAAYDALSAEVFYGIRKAAEDYAGNDFTVNMHNVQRSLPETLRGRSRFVYDVLKRMKLPLRRDPDWTNIFYGRKSDITRYGKSHGLM